MFPRPKLLIILCALFCAVLLAATLAVTAQTTSVERTRGSATVKTSEVTGEVVQVEGNNLVVKLPSGENRLFVVPENRIFVIDGKELSVRDLLPGTTLTATVKTTTTPISVRTKSVMNAKVWYAAAPTIILTLPDGTNKQYYVKDDNPIRFMVNGRPATVFELRKGMVVSVEKIVEEPEEEIATDTTVTGHAPATASAPTTAAPPTGQPAASEAAAPGAAQSAAPETTAPATPEPAASETGGITTRPLVWVGLIVLLVIIIVIVARKAREKK